MTLFFLIYVSIYGGVHLYAFLKLKKGFALGLSANVILAIFMILMVVAPIAVRIAERHGNEALARGFAYIGFVWMGLLFIFFSVSFFFDIYRLLHLLARMLTRNPLSAFTLSLRTFCTLAILTSFAVMIYGYFEALAIRTEHVTVETDKISEKTLLETLPRDKFTLFLKHQPVINRESLDRFDLQLSGHTHKGQIFPFNLVTQLFYPMHTGLSKISGNSQIYVSRGSGTWGPPVRFLSPPEVTVVDIIYKRRKQ